MQNEKIIADIVTLNIAKVSSGAIKTHPQRKYCYIM